MAYDEATQAALDRIDDEVAETEPKIFADINSVPNGEYEVTLLAAYIESTRNGKLVGNFDMEVDRGDNAGSPVQKTCWLENDDRERQKKNIAAYKGDLQICGFDSNNKGIKDIIAALPSLSGSRLLIYVSRNEGNNGKTYVNIKLKKLLAKPSAGDVPDISDPFDPSDPFNGQ